ncbi:MAG: endonuclease III [Ignavibacteriae bacterium]|nr:endonuclease III [Ignavibacteriota bacterium]
MQKSKHERNWLESLLPLFKQYKNMKHPLEYQNRYQLVVVVILSSRTSDKSVNVASKKLFQQFPTLASLSITTIEELYPFIKSIPGFRKKGTWLIELAKQVKSDEDIPRRQKELTTLPGIGRKTANVIMSESGDTMEGVIVDLHVLRVAPRIGLATGTNPEKIEKQMMEIFPQKYWRQLGMSLTFLGREICRPTNPKCHECPMNPVCEYFKSNQ